MFRCFRRAPGVTILCLFSLFARAQQQDSAALSREPAWRMTRDPDYTPPGHQWYQQSAYGQWDILMNPIYITQVAGRYKLNGVPKGYAPLPAFYALQPGQNALIGNVLTDEAGGYYGSMRVCAFEHSRLKFFHHMRLMAGVTHDKLQTSSQQVYFKYNDGGTEAVVMLEKNLLPGVTEADYHDLRLIFNWNAQAGLFAALAKITTHIMADGDTVVGVNDSRLQWPDPRSGWGGILASNFEVGVPVCYRFFICRRFTQTRVGKALFWWFRRGAITVGARLMAEYLHSGVDVTLNGQSGYHLTQNNFALSFSGPIISLKIIDKL